MARDIPASISTKATLDSEGFVRSVIDRRGDHDWYRVDLDPGDYVIRLGGTGEHGIGHPLLIIRDENGRVVARSDSPYGDTTLNVDGADAGTYYVDVSGLEPGRMPRGELGAGQKIGHLTGDYTLSVNRLDGSPLDAIAGSAWFEKRVVDVWFAPRGASGEINNRTVTIESAGWNDYQIRQAMAALEAFSDVCDLDFRLVGKRAQADLDVLLYGEPGAPVSGIFQPQGSLGEGTGAFAGGPDAVARNDWADRPGGGLEPGAPGWGLLLHEFGHAVGLMHPHDTGLGSVVMEGIKPPDRDGSYPNRPGDFGLNDTLYTVMSYRGMSVGDASRRDYGHAMGPMAFDIAVLQQMYGATRAHHGDDSYTLPGRNALGTGYLCLWDTGGEDTIRAGRTDRDVTINLNAATLLYEPGGGGFLSSARGVKGGFTIANSVELENATGGNGDDRLVGNDLDNRLAGGRGGDWFRGGAGADKLHAGDDNARDVFVYRARSDSGLTRADADRIDRFDGRSSRREATWDRIDLTQLDGDADARGNQPLRFVQAFDAPGAGEPPGQVRAEARGDNMHVLIDLDGDNAADMRLILLDTDRLGAADFLL